MNRRGILAALAGAALVACVSAPTAPPKTMETDAARLAKGPVREEPNTAVDPCVDFDEYANGAWRAANPIPPSKTRWSRRAVAREGNRRHVREILEALASRTGAPPGSNEQVLGDHYAACMDEAAIDAAGAAPIAPWLTEIEQARTPADVQRVIRRLHDLGVPAPFAVAFGFDYGEPDRFVLSLTDGGLGLPDREAYLGPEPLRALARERYRAHVARMLGLSGVPEAEARASAADVLALETRLAAASLGRAQAEDPATTHHPTSFAVLETLAPHVDWSAYFDEARLPRVAVNVAQPKLLAQVDIELARTPVATWKAYLRWQLVRFAAPSLSASFARASSDFGEGGGGAHETPPRWLTCVESTETLFGDALGAKFVERHFSPAAKAKIEALGRSLLAALKEEVGTLEWMTPETKARALEKLSTFDLQVGYPAASQPESPVTVGRRSFWENVVAGQRRKIAEDRRRVGGRTDHARWALAPSSPDAYIEPQLNQMVLPAGFLQPPMFDPEATDAEIFGGVGVGMAHDMTHSLDALGAEFDPKGKPLSWWSDADKAAYTERSRCVVAQVESFEVEPGLHHQAKLVLGEALADLAGVRVAYRALQASQRGAPPRVADGGTPEQRFFLGMARARGDEMKPEAERAQVQTDIHPVARYRITGTLANLPEFQRAFACPAGAPMVRSPSQRCAVW
jgi:endothelin-converting enzyme/putative endopeptidase